MDCFSTSTGHGLLQVFKPGNLFLNILWIVFVAVAIGGCSLFIYQAVDQFLQYSFITMTDIKRETKLTFPIITICSVGDTQDMIIDCTYGRYAYSDCNIKNLTLYVCDGFQQNCVQMNYNLNKSELYQVFWCSQLERLLYFILPACRPVDHIRCH